MKKLGECVDKVVLFSGRFDPFHLGHLLTILKLGKIYKKIIVVILDHFESKYPISYRKEAIIQSLSYYNIDYEVIVNKIHFAKITKNELSKYKFDIYAAGNLEVLKHIESLGYETVYVERSFEYSGTEIRKNNN